MQLTIAEASQRLSVTPRRVRSLVERGQLPAVRRGGMWLTTDDAVDAYRRNSPGRGRPISAGTAWARIRDFARDGDIAALSAARPSLRARATHRIYSLPDLVARRIGSPKGTYRSGVDALGIRLNGEPLDLYATTTAAEQLIRLSGAAPAADGLLYLHVLEPGLDLPELTERERMVLAWCDLADAVNPAADVAARRLWPDSIEVQQLADIVRDHTTVEYSAIRGFTDWLQRHPHLTADAIASPPAPSDNPALDSLYAAIAETAAADAGIDPPGWTRRIRDAGAPEHVSPLPSADDVPVAFTKRGIPFPRDTFWHQR